MSICNVKLQTGKTKLDVILNLVVLKGTLSSLRQFVTIEYPLKVMKNAFYFMLKALFVIEILTFLSCFYVLHNISRSKDNNPMKLVR